MRPGRARDLLLYVVGRADERWYWLYQDLLCRLDEDPRAADAMYQPETARHPATCGSAANPRAPRGPGPTPNR